jgi:DNA polymerase III subunit delta
MKLGGREALAFFRKPDPGKAGLLISGDDPMRVAARRQEVLAAMVGPEAEAEMRLTRMSGADLRKDGALLLDAVKAIGFFPGPRAVFVEEVTDGLAEVFAGALKDWRPGDAQIVATGGALGAKSALRKLFEGSPVAVSIVIYDDPPSAEEISARLAEAGLGRIGADAKAAIMELGRSLDPGDFRQVVEKLSLYKYGDAGEVTLEDVAACAPQSTEAEADDLIRIVAEGRSGEIAGVLRRLYAQGVGPVTLCIGALRHFRVLHQVASAPGGPGEGVGRLRPPVFGPRRDVIVRQAQAWGVARLERGIVVLLDTDLQLRSASEAPGQALVERALLRLAMMSRA